MVKQPAICGEGSRRPVLVLEPRCSRGSLLSYAKTACVRLPAIEFDMKRLDIHGICLHIYKLLETLIEMQGRFDHLELLLVGTIEMSRFVTFATNALYVLISSRIKDTIVKPEETHVSRSMRQLSNTRQIWGWKHFRPLR